MKFLSALICLTIPLTTHAADAVEGLSGKGDRYCIDYIKMHIIKSDEFWAPLGADSETRKKFADIRLQNLCNSKPDIDGNTTIYDMNTPFFAKVEKCEPVELGNSPVFSIKDDGSYPLNYSVSSSMKFLRIKKQESMMDIDVPGHPFKSKLLFKYIPQTESAESVAAAKAELRKQCEAVNGRTVSYPDLPAKEGFTSVQFACVADEVFYDYSPYQNITPKMMACQRAAQSIYGEKLLALDSCKEITQTDFDTIKPEASMKMKVKMEVRVYSDQSDSKEEAEEWDCRQAERCMRNLQDVPALEKVYGKEASAEIRNLNTKCVTKKTDPGVADGKREAKPKTDSESLPGEAGSSETKTK